MKNSKLKVKLNKLEPTVTTPEHATEGSAGLDLKSTEVVSLPPFSRRLVKTGIKIKLPDGYEAQVRPRSGNALKKGITVLNSPGTIDSDYIGEIGVILYNASNTPVTVFKGDKIAQLVIAKYEKVEWDEVEVLEETQRGSGGFGSTDL